MLVLNYKYFFWISFMNKKVLNCFQHIDKCESCYEPLPMNYFNSWKMQNDKHENFIIELLS